MKRDDGILDELASWGSPLASVPRVMPYRVPENYFENLCDNICENVKNADSAEPNINWNKDLPFQVPQGYFESLPEQILAHVKENEDKLDLGKVHPYSVPQRYFETLPQQILAAAKMQEKERRTKVIPLGDNLWRFARIAAAAIFVAGLGFGSYEFLTNRNHPNPEIALAKIPANVIKDYAQLNIDDFDVYMNVNNLEVNKSADKYTQHLSPQEIEQYLDETGGQKTLD